MPHRSGGPRSSTDDQSTRHPRGVFAAIGPRGGDVPLLFMEELMLVLSRKKHEALIVGEARVVVEAINGNKVRLAIEAPPHINIVREEVADREKEAGK